MDNFYCVTYLHNRDDRESGRLISDIVGIQKSRPLLSLDSEMFCVSDVIPKITEIERFNTMKMDIVSFLVEQPLIGFFFNESDRRLNWISNIALTSPQLNETSLSIYIVLFISLRVQQSVHLIEPENFSDQK